MKREQSAKGAGGGLPLVPQTTPQPAPASKAVHPPEPATDPHRALLEEAIQRAVDRFGEVVDSRVAVTLTGLASSTLAGRRSDPRRGPHPPYIRIRRSIRFRTADLVRWIFERRVDPDDAGTH